MTANPDIDTCNFAISVDLREGIDTGISAQDRALTILKIADERSRAEDFVRPGHIFPLNALKGGVLKRSGHTEAAVDLCQLAGLKKAGVICEIMNEDGTMARVPDILKFAAKHELKVISIAELIAYRRKSENLVELISKATLPTPWGQFAIQVFEEKLTKLEHVALIKGDLSKEPDPLVRVHSECLTGDVFFSQRCDCRAQLDAALSQIAAEGAGVFVLMRQEGRGIGLGNKIAAYHLQEQGSDTVEANEKLGFKSDLRDYGIGAQILKLLGVSQMRLLTNNPQKLVGLEGHDLKITKRLPLETEPTAENRHYLQTKKEKMGHLFGKI
jgi:3,4-dihydroxy 2-butanone 4-phosphate synthase/GTP cyclohydrolase II